MEFKKHNKKYLNKLRDMYPDYEIPSDERVEETLSEMENDDEAIIGDLIIRVWDNIIELELV